MTDHYYSKDPHSTFVTSTISTVLRDESFVFTSGASVFSKKGIDFGSKLLIETFEEPAIEGSLLDLGCGYGPIGITLARVYPKRHVVMVDINERACLLAKQNAKQNEVENVEVFQSDGFTNIEHFSFAAIVTNPPIRAGKKVMYSLLEKSFQQLITRGELWVVIQKKQGAPSLIAFLETFFHSVQIVTRKKGYYIIRAIKD